MSSESRSALATDSDAPAVGRAIQTIETAIALGQSVERAIAAQQHDVIGSYLERRQACLESLVSLIRDEGVRLDDEAVHPRWLALLAQDRITQQNLKRAMTRLQGKLSKVRQSLNTTAAYGERAPRARASLVDLRG